MAIFGLAVIGDMHLPTEDRAGRRQHAGRPSRVWILAILSWMDKKGVGQFLPTSKILPSFRAPCALFLTLGDLPWVIIFPVKSAGSDPVEVPWFV